MLRFLLGIVLAGFLALPAHAQGAGTARPCNSEVVYDTNTNGATQMLAAGTSGYFVCGYSLFSAGTVNVSLVRGTGTACATGRVALTPAYQFTAQTGLVDPSPYFRGMFVPTGQQLCILTNAAVSVQAIVYYSPG